MPDAPASTDNNNYARVTLEAASEGPSILGEPVTIIVEGRDLTAHPVKVSMFTMIAIETDAIERMRMVMKILDASLDSDDAEWLKERLYDNESSVEMNTFMDIYNALQEHFAERPTESRTD